jgi:hypothetical protein
MSLLLASFKGIVIVSWLIVSFSLGMVGLCEINALTEVKKNELIDQKKAVLKKPQPSSKFIYKGVEFQSKEEMEIFIAQADPEEPSPATSSDINEEPSETFEYNGIIFENKEEIRDYVAQENWEASLSMKFSKIKKQILGDFGGSLVFILTAISFGVIGTLTEQIKRIVVCKRERNRAKRNGQNVQCDYILEDISILYRPLFGGLVGFMALGVTSLIPMLLQTTTEYNVIRPTSLLFLCFFSGVMSDEIYEWLISMMRNFFKKQLKPLEVLK